MSHHADVPWVSVKHVFVFFLVLCFPPLSTLHLPTKKTWFSLCWISFRRFQSRGRDSSASPSTTPVLVLLELFEFFYVSTVYYYSNYYCVEMNSSHVVKPMSKLIEALLSGVIFESQVTLKHYRILARYDKGHGWCCKETIKCNDKR